MAAMAGDMLSPLEEGTRRIASVGERLFVGLSDVFERVLILLSDVVLIFLAAIALAQDWGHQCDENLPAYALCCVLLSFLDLAWEFVRCSLDSALDRLQQDFKPEGGFVDDNNLLGEGPFEDEGPLGSPTVNSNQPDVSPSRFGSIAAGVLGKGIRREKNMRKKMAHNLQFWSLVFTASVSMLFSAFFQHNLECKEQMPSLYLYLHTFTYVYIFRLGIILVWGCCRTVKNYEDAAKAGHGLGGKRSTSQQMAEIS